MAIYYHGTNAIFNEFDASFSNHEGFIYVSPCKNMSLSYIPRSGGYLYTLEIDESNENYHLSIEYGKICGCRAYSDFSNFKILKVERIEYDGIAMKKTKCGNTGMVFCRPGYLTLTNI